MRAFIIFICAIVSASGSAIAVGTDGALTGKMTNFGYLLGGQWSCSRIMADVTGGPTRTDSSSVRYDVAPGNTIHMHSQSDVLSSDTYIGYDSKQGIYWRAGIESNGLRGFSSSHDGVTFSGAATVGATVFASTLIFAKVSDKEISLHGVLSVSGSTYESESQCTR